MLLIYGMGEGGGGGSKGFIQRKDDKLAIPFIGGTDEGWDRLGKGLSDDREKRRTGQRAGRGRGRGREKYEEDRTIGYSWFTSP